MRNRYEFVAPILDYMGALFWIFGFVLAVPLAAQLYYARSLRLRARRLCWVFC